jgi:hypothetical protein
MRTCTHRLTTYSLSHTHRAVSMGLLLLPLDGITWVLLASIKRNLIEEESYMENRLRAVASGDGRNLKIWFKRRSHSSDPGGRSE